MFRSHALARAASTKSKNSTPKKKRESGQMLLGSGKKGARNCGRITAAAQRQGRSGTKRLVIMVGMNNPKYQ